MSRCYLFPTIQNFAISVWRQILYFILGLLTAPIPEFQVHSEVTTSHNNNNNNNNNNNGKLSPHPNLHLSKYQEQQQLSPPSSSAQLEPPGNRNKTRLSKYVERVAPPGVVTTLEDYLSTYMAAATETQKRPLNMDNKSSPAHKIASHELGLELLTTTTISDDRGNFTEFWSSSSSYPLLFKPLVFTIKKTTIKLPITSSANLNALERRVKDDWKIRATLYEQLSRSGGEDEESCIEKVLSTLISSQLREEIDWTTSFRSGSTAIQNVVFEAVSFHHPNVTETQLEDFARKWFSPNVEN